MPRAPKVTVELDDADGRPIAKVNAEATTTGGKSGSAKGSASGPTAYRFTHLKPCPGCTVRLLAGSVVQDSVAVDVTGDDPSIHRQDLEFDRLPGGTWVDGAVNVPAGVGAVVGVGPGPPGRHRGRRLDQARQPMLGGEGRRARRDDPLRERDDRWHVAVSARQDPAEPARI